VDGMWSGGPLCVLSGLTAWGQSGNKVAGLFTASFRSEKQRKTKKDVRQDDGNTSTASVWSDTGNKLSHPYVIIFRRPVYMLHVLSMRYVTVVFTG